MNLNKIHNPSLFQGDITRKDYFEGWYMKQVSEDEKTIISFIPGVSLFEKDRHSFIQYILVNSTEKGIVSRTGYVRFAVDEFSYEKEWFSASVGGNEFSSTGLRVKLDDEGFEIEGELNYGNFSHIERSLWMPNIMGPFGYLPNMECYHGLVSMSHKVTGSLKIGGQTIDFGKGKGYIEKDWGTSFPREYVWIHSNHFSDSTASLFFSKALIPFVGFTFDGYICNLVVGNKEYRFATYDIGSLKVISRDATHFSVQLRNLSHELVIHAKTVNPGILIAPDKGKMGKKIKEEVRGEVSFKLKDFKSGKLIYEESKIAGIEYVSKEK